MNLVPLSVIVVLDKRSRYSNVRTNGRNDRVVTEGAAGGLRVCLGHVKMTHDLEDEIALYRR